MVQPDNLPAQLRESGLFCCWRYAHREGTDKLTKIPFNPRTGGKAQSTNPQTFAPLAVALEALERDGYNGIGVGIFGNLGAIDIDHCVDEDGKLSPMALDIVRAMGTYTEFSPSGKGLRILFTVPEGFQYDKARYYINNQRAGLEVYIAGATQKYVTVTGNAINPGYPLEERGERLAAILEKYMVRPRAQEPPPARVPAPLDWGSEINDSPSAELDDLALIERAKRSKNGAQFTALWAGDITGYKSASEADIALCNTLAWWTNGNADRVDHLFRQSGLFRPDKWDRPTAGSTYGALTIQNAVSTARGGYDPAAYRRQPADRNSMPVADTSVPVSYEPFEPPDTSRLPAFPVDKLPPVLRDFAQAVAENLQVAVDMPALQVLAVMALCVQGKFIINPKPGWVEPLNLYAVTVARPSDRKSPTLQVCTRHPRDYVREENERRRPLVEEYRMRRDVLAKKISNMKEMAAKPIPAKGKTVDLDDITELQYQLADLEREAVKPLRLLADDVTPEALISLMAENGGKMAIVSDEGGIFDIAAGRYSDRVNLDAFLKAYSGTTIQIDRKGRPSESIDHPALTMSLTVQPAVLEAVMGNGEFSRRGFLARFLYSLPVSTVGLRHYETGHVPLDVENAYNQLQDRLLTIEDTGEARIIKLSPEAHTESRRFSEALEPRLLNDLEEIEEWAGKYHGQIMRIAGIIHCCFYGREAASKPVSLDTIQRTEAIGEYFLEHALVAFRIGGLADRPEEKDAKYIWRRLEADGRMELNKRDFLRLCQKFHTAEDMEPGLAELSKRGYIWVETVKTGKPGKPPQIIHLNPEAKCLK